MNNQLNGIEISLTVGCRLDCDYCPQKLLLEKYYGQDKNRARKLSFGNFKIALEQIVPGGSVVFAGMSEPFHNEECADMIVYAYEKGYKICLDTTLVGMTMADFEKIKHIRFDEFILHIPDKENHSKFVITDEYLRLFKIVNETINISYYSCHGMVHDAISGILDKEKYVSTSLHNRAGNLKHKNMKNIFVNGDIICWQGTKYGAWKPILLPDGTLLLCCMDYGMKHILGNLIHQSWKEICDGDEYKKIENGLKDDSVDILCRNCGLAKKVESLPSMKLKRSVADIKSGGVLQLPTDVRNIVERLAMAEHICVFGLGKLWRDHFYQEYWGEGLGVSLFSDNNADLQGKDINGIKCVKPIELKEYKNLLVVLFVKNGESILSQLNGLGIDNCIMIDELYKIQ